MRSTLRSPDSTAGTSGSSGADGFEFAALALAENYRRSIVDRFRGVLTGRVLEVGAGIGQMTAALRQLPGLSELVSVEPDTELCRRFRTALPGQRLIEGTASAVASTELWDGIVSVNVLEHILEDSAELSLYRSLLARRQGYLCLLVPARPEIYAPIDRDFGHHRRYTRQELSLKLRNAGFDISGLCYANFVGYFAWWLNFCVLKKREFDPAAVRWFDRVIHPPAYWCEKNLFPPPIGQSLVAIARAKAERTA